MVEQLFALFTALCFKIIFKVFGGFFEQPQVKLDTGEEVETYTYIYNRSVDALEKISSGDCKRFWR